jgi:hypothetical protein
LCAVGQKIYIYSSSALYTCVFKEIINMQFAPCFRAKLFQARSIVKFPGPTVCATSDLNRLEGLRLTQSLVAQRIGIGSRAHVVPTRPAIST